MTTVLLSAGKATRLGGGCKALTKVGGITMYGWVTAAAGEEPLVVARSEHLPELDEHSVDHIFVHDDLGGPAAALHAALPMCDEGPLTVLYADTWLRELPDGDEWCGVAAALGGRNWDVAECGLLAYRYVDNDEVAVVAVGAYRFPAKWKLERALDHELRTGQGEVGLADVVNDLALPLLPIVGWQDVGDLASLDRWRNA